MAGQTIKRRSLHTFCAVNFGNLFGCPSPHINFVHVSKTSEPHRNFGFPTSCRWYSHCYLLSMLRRQQPRRQRDRDRDREKQHREREPPWEEPPLTVTSGDSGRRRGGRSGSDWAVFLNGS